MAKRREKGDGSIYQRESDGRFVAYARMENGKKRYMYAKTRKEVAKKLKELQKSINNQTLITAKPESVEAYLTNWLVSKRIKETTHQNYSYAIKAVVPYIGSTLLTKLNSDQIQKTYFALEKEYAPGTIRLVHRVLKTAFNDAIKHKKLTNNPCVNVTQPEETKEEAIALTADQCQRLIDMAKGTRIECFVIFALATALRRGELLGLRWADIDLDEKTVKVQRTLSYLPDPQTGKYRFIETTPKSKSSRRIIPLTDFALVALKAHRTRQLEQRLQAGAKWQEKDLVFPGKDGDYWIATVLVYHFEKIVKEAGIPAICIHELRHSSATLLRRKGVDLKIIQKILGHSNYAITANIYEHVDMDDQQDAMQKMDDLFGPIM